MDPVVTYRAGEPGQLGGRSGPAAPPAGTEETDYSAWWHDAVMYEVYVRSFADADGDGVGDIEGIRRRLPDLADLGVDGIWVSPFYRSPMADHGYDVADHTDVDPLFGTLSDVDALLRDAHEAGLKVVVDLVPNHSSSAHPAFQAALAAGPGAPERDLYLFRDGRGPDGALPPNNWISVFGGPAWTRVPDGQWYLHLFAPEQPDWNWQHPRVRAAHAEIIRFWLDRGVDGFRIDVSHGLVKDGELRDHPTGALSTPETGFREEIEPHAWDQDGVHEIYREWRAIVDAHDRRDGRQRVLVGETWVADPGRLARYVRPDELHLTFTFSLLYAPFSAPAWRAAIDAARAATAAVHAPPTWVLANHDVVRPVSRYGGGEAGLRRARAALLTLLALPGTVYLYQGDELGLPQVDIPPEARQDPVWERSGHTSPGRDGARVPLPWSGDAPPYGFSAGAAEPWLPQPPDWATLTASAQSVDPMSTRVLVRGALALRRALPFLGGPAGPGGAAEPGGPGHSGEPGRPAGTRPGFRWRDDLPADCLAFDRTSAAGALTCVMATRSETRLEIAGRLVLASGPVGYDGATLVLPPNTTAWVIPRSG